MAEEFESPKDVQTTTSDSATSAIASEAYDRNQPAKIEQNKESSDSANDLLGGLIIVDSPKRNAADSPASSDTDTSFRLDSNGLPPLSIVFDATPTFDASPKAALTPDATSATPLSDTAPAAHVVGDAGQGKNQSDAKPVPDDGHAQPGDDHAKPGDGRPGAPNKPTDAAQKVESGPLYAGEEIKRDVAVDKNYEVKAGETLHDIAKKHLGPGASEADIQKHMKEIVAVNGLDSKVPLSEGEHLRLPGHTKDGGFVMPTLGNPGTRTVWKDGRVKEEYTDGTGFERTPIPRKGKDAAELDRMFPEFVEKHHGPKPEDNYEIHKVLGEYYIKDPGKEEFKPLPGQDIRYDRAKISDQAERNIKDPYELEQFKQDMAAFEQRAKEAKPPLSQEEIARTYSELSKLMEAGGDKPLTHEERVKIATQALHHAAFPESIAQGNHNTCNVATIETRMYTREPSAAIRLVADASIKGEVKLNDGTVVKIDPADSLKPHDTSKKGSTTEDRDHASQVFQVTAVNAHHATHKFKGFDKDGKPIELPPGAVRYVQVEPKDANDTGERLMDYSDPKNPKPVYEAETKNTTDVHGQPTTKTTYKEIQKPSIEVGELTKLYDNISRKIPSDRGVVIENATENHADPEKMKAEAKKIHDACHIYGNDDDKIFAALKGKTPEQIEEMKKQFQETYGESMYEYLKDQMKRHPTEWEKAKDLLNPKEAPNKTDEVYVKSPEKLESKIKELKEQGKLPITIMVDSNNDPFFLDSGGGKAGGSGSWHVVTITDYHPAENGKPARVDIQNQWGDNANHFDKDGKAINMDDLFEATYKAGRADQIKRLQQEVKENKESGNIDSVKELQLLRMEVANGMITQQQYAENVARVMREADARWKTPGDKTTPEEAKRVREYYRAVLYGFDRSGLLKEATAGVNRLDWDPDHVPDYRNPQ